MRKHSSPRSHDCAASDDDRMERIGKIASEMTQLQERRTRARQDAAAPGAQDSLRVDLTDRARRLALRSVGRGR